MNRERADVISTNLLSFILEIQEYIQKGYYICETDVPYLAGWAYQAVLYKDEKKTLGRPKESK